MLGTQIANPVSRRSFFMSRQRPFTTGKRRSSARVALLAGLSLLGVVSTSLWSQQGFAQPKTESLPSLTKQIEQAQTELLLSEAARDRSQRELTQRESEQAKLVTQIEQLKAQPPGPVRDLRLDGLLAQAKDRADDLQQRALLSQQQMALVTAQQRKLLGLCDRRLAGEGGALEGGKRVLLVRLRAQLSERLYADEPERLRTVALTSAALEQKTAPSDDPQGLRERADLLRDSADKLLRELSRLKDRREALAARQRVRQRAASVDEDLFAEQATARRGSGGAQGTFGANKLADAATAPAPGGPVVLPPAAEPTPTVGSGALRTSLDPSMLDALLRSDAASDAAAQADQLQRAESELRSLAQQLQRRAAQLDQQATGLAGKK